MSDPVLLPGSTIGVFGSGQLGRMLALAARPMGYKIATYSLEADSPAGQVCDRESVGAYDDGHRVREFCAHVDVVTFEFENVPVAVAEIAADIGVPVRPSGSVLHIAQNRQREKTTLHDAGLPVTPFATVAAPADLDDAVDLLGLPLVLKTADFGYDGKGQLKVTQRDESVALWQRFGASRAIAETYVDFFCEISVVAARGLGGEFVHYGAIENVHTNHILDISVAPARISDATRADAVEITRQVLETLDVIGVMCIEFFVQRDGTLLINEIAPRPHNSGHLTIEATQCSQFEQQLRAVCGLPLGPTDLLQPAVMVNLLGDLWHNGEPDWQPILARPGCHLHLYGKGEARNGRKMGHVTVVGKSVEEALTIAQEVKLRYQ